MWRARYRIPRKLAARFFGRCETWIKRVQSGKYAPKDLHERILEALIRWSALEEIANGKPGGVEQIKRDIASTHIRAGIAAGSAAPLTIRHMAPGRTASDGRNRPKAIIRRRRPNDANRRLAAVADRGRERRKWAGKRALPLGAVSAQSGLCRKASARPVTQPRCLPSA